jgi:EmrB/QacA subfamily drug resistance transporter
MAIPGFSTLPQRWRTLIAVGFGTFMATMDFSIINVALPTFSREFERSPDAVVWATLGGSLVVTGLTLTAGRAGDLYGRKRVYLIGWGIFTVACAGASFAQSLEQLIALRLLQSVGVSLAIANSNAIVTDAFPDHERGRALGVVTSVVGAGLMAGPIAGGLVLQWLDWRAIFYLRVPVGLLAILMGIYQVRERTTERPSERRMDIPGALLLFVGLSALLTAVNRGQSWGWMSPAILGLGTAGLVGFALFLWQESRTVSPILSLALFRMRSYGLSIASLIVSFVGQASVIFLMPFYLIEVRGFSTAETGLILAMVPVMLLVFAPLSGLVADRTGSPQQATVGLAIVTAGLLWLAALSEQTPVPIVLAMLALVGFGSVVFGPPNTSTVMGSVPRPMLGTASASVAAARNVGNAVGLAVASAVVVIVGGTAGVGEVVAPSDLLAGIRAAFLVAGVLSSIAIVVSAFGGTKRPVPARPVPPSAPSAVPGDDE